MGSWEGSRRGRSLEFLGSRLNGPAIRVDPVTASHNHPRHVDCWQNDMSDLGTGTPNPEPNAPN